MASARSNYNRTAGRMTLGDLCQAISNGALPATVENSEWYIVSGRDIRRLTTKRPVQKSGRFCAV